MEDEEIMRNFLIQENKMDAVVDYLTNVNKQRKYNLYLISCYIDKEFPFDFIKSIVASVRLKNIYIYIDRNEVFRVGQKEIKTLLKRIRQSISMQGLDIEINLSCIKGYPGIFHCKAYVLVNYDSKKKIEEGSMVVGSANLSVKGLSNSRGNFETLIGLNSKKDLKDIIDTIETIDDSKMFVDFENITVFQDINIDNEFSWQYALLKSGYFVHKWSDNLRNELSVKFYLSDEGQKTVQSDELAQLGFSLDTKTISKNYFNFTFPAVHLGGDKDFLKLHGLETYMGHWIPKGALAIENNNEFNLFKERLEIELNEQQGGILNSIGEDRGRLLEMGLITESYQPRVFTEKHINSLLSDNLKLYRIYTKYQIYELPLDYSQDDEIGHVYEDLISTLNAKKKNWPVCKALKKAVENMDLKFLVEEYL